MAKKTGWRKYGAIRWFTVIGVGIVLVLVLRYGFGVDMDRGSSTRYAVLIPLAIVAVGVLELWHRLLPPADQKPLGR